MPQAATRKGVDESKELHAGMETPGSEAEPVKLHPDHPLAKREALMEGIDDARLKHYEEESGLKLTEPEPAKAAEEPKAEEPKAADDGDTAADAEKQAAAQSDDLILDDDTLKRAKVRTKVDGVEELVPAAKVLASYQKGLAADHRLAQATEALRAAEAKAAQIAAQAATPSVKDEAPKPTVDLAAKFKEASDALFEGDGEKASRLFAEAVAASTTPTTVGRGESATLDRSEIVKSVTAAVTQQLSEQSALEKLFSDYPEIKADEDLALLADRRVDLYEKQGTPRAEAILKAGEDIGEKFKLGKFNKPATGRPLKTDAPTTREDKLAGKAEIDNLPSTGARVADTSEPDDTPQSVIAEIARSRPGARL